jgi:hypothetical protein
MEHHCNQQYEQATEGLVSLEWHGDLHEGTKGWKGGVPVRRHLIIKADEGGWYSTALFEPGAPQACATHVFFCPFCGQELI